MRKRLLSVLLSICLMGSASIFCVSAEEAAFSKNKYNFIEVLPPTYDGVGIFKDGLAPAWFIDRVTLDRGEEHKTGLIDINGKEIIKPVYDYYGPFTEGLAMFGKNGDVGVSGKVSYFDKSGREVIKELPYDYAEQFNRGLAIVGKKIYKASPYNQSVYIDTMKYGVIDKTGKEIVKPTYDRVVVYPDGYIGVCLNNNWGILDKNGRLIVKPIYQGVNENYEESPLFNSGLAMVSKNGKKLYINTSGKETTKLSYNSATPYNKGVAVVMRNDKKSVLINTLGKEISKPYDKIEEFFQDAACVKKGGKYGFINLTGKEIVIPVYDSVLEVYDSGRRRFSYNDLATVAVGGNWGIVNAKTGKVIVKPAYKDIRTPDYPCYENVIRMSVGSGIIFFDKSGREIAKTDYYGMTPYKNGLSRVYCIGRGIYGSYGFADDKGKEIIKAEYDELSEFDKETGLAFYKKGKKHGFIDKSGNIIKEVDYDAVDGFSEGFAGVRHNWEWITIDKNLDEVVASDYGYDEIHPGTEGIMTYRKNGKIGLLKNPLIQ